MAPSVPSSPRLAAISSVTGWMWTPSQPRMTRPWAMRSSMTAVAVAAGTAKPIPTFARPEGETMEVFTPMTSPCRLTVGPPRVSAV